MLRPKRIAEGLTKAILQQHTTVSTKRMGICNNCPNKKGVACGICGCILSAKTKVLEEACPENRWEDIKISPDRGIAFRLHETDKATIGIEDGVLTVRHKNTYTQGEPVENTLLTFDVINLRADEKSIEAKDIKLTNLWMKHCSCYESRLDSKSHNKKENAYEVLDDSQHIKLTLKYDTTLDPLGYSMNKDIKLVTDQCTLTLRIKGEVKTK